MWQLLLIGWTMTSKPLHSLASSKMYRAKSHETAQSTQTQSCQMPMSMFKARNTSWTATTQNPRSSAPKKKTKNIDRQRSLATKAHKACKLQSTQLIWKWWQVQVLRTMMKTFRMLGCTDRRYSCRTWSWWLTSIPSPSCFRCSPNQALMSQRLSTRSWSRLPTRKTRSWNANKESVMKFQSWFLTMALRLVSLSPLWLPLVWLPSSLPSQERKSKCAKSNLMGFSWRSKSCCWLCIRSRWSSIWPSTLRPTKTCATSPPRSILHHLVCPPKWPSSPTKKTSCSKSCSKCTRKTKSYSWCRRMSIRSWPFLIFKTTWVESTTSTNGSLLKSSSSKNAKSLHTASRNSLATLSILSEPSTLTRVWNLLIRANAWLYKAWWMRSTSWWFKGRLLIYNRRHKTDFRKTLPPITLQTLTRMLMPLSTTIRACSTRLTLRDLWLRSLSEAKKVLLSRHHLGCTSYTD